MRKGNDWRKKDQIKEGTEWDRDRRSPGKRLQRGAGKRRTGKMKAISKMSNIVSFEERLSQKG